MVTNQMTDVEWISTYGSLPSVETERLSCGQATEFLWNTRDYDHDFLTAIPSHTGMCTLFKVRVALLAMVSSGLFHGAWLVSGSRPYNRLYVVDRIRGLASRLGWRSLLSGTRISIYLTSAPTPSIHSDGRRTSVVERLWRARFEFE